MTIKTFNHYQKAQVAAAAARGKMRASTLDAHRWRRAPKLLFIPASREVIGDVRYHAAFRHDVEASGAGRRAVITARRAEGARLMPVRFGTNWGISEEAHAERPGRRAGRRDMARYRAYDRRASNP